MINDIQKMKELINKITEANEAYFQKDEPIMTDREYDSLVLELTILEKQTGIHFSNSPIGKVPTDAKAGLETVKHSKPMLSCNKTKSMEEFVDFLKVNDAIISWKIDGLTLVLRYENGKFKQAVTKNQIIGEFEDDTWIFLTQGRNKRYVKFHAHEDKIRKNMTEKEYERFILNLKTLAMLRFGSSAQTAISEMVRYILE